VQPCSACAGTGEDRSPYDPDPYCWICKGSGESLAPVPPVPTTNSKCLYDELGVPLWRSLKTTGPGWYEVRSGHWELLLWMNEAPDNQWPDGAGWLAHIETFEGAESDLTSKWFDEATVRYRLPTVWDHLLRFE